jgi:hypothetical protein
LLYLNLGCYETDPSCSCLWHSIIRELSKTTFFFHTIRSLCLSFTRERQSMGRDGLGSSLTTLYVRGMFLLQDSIAIYLQGRTPSYKFEPLEEFHLRCFHPCPSAYTYTQLLRTILRSGLPLGCMLFLQQRAAATPSPALSPNGEKDLRRDSWSSLLLRTAT